MNNSLDISEPNVWESILTTEEYRKVVDIIEKMQCNPKPSVMEFLATIRKALEQNLIIKPEVKEIA